MKVKVKKMLKQAFTLQINDILGQSTSTISKEELKKPMTGYNSPRKVLNPISYDDEKSRDPNLTTLVLTNLTESDKF